jgi:hypothetical protein
MSFKTINRCAQDPSFQGRVNACVATQGRDNPYPDMLAIIWPVSAKSDIEAAYASAVAANNPDPGGDESVISDGMILAATQAELPAAP